MTEIFPVMDDDRVRELRGPKNRVDPFRPYAFLHEKEFQSLAGKAEAVNTLFLANRECRYSCLMCDLWKNSLDETVLPGAIPEQIRWGLEQLPPAQHLKLYNGSSFFDPQAIPEEDYPAIADLVRPFESLVVENHPRLTDNRSLEFARMIRPRLQVAMGLESVHPGGLKQLNKRMSLEDYSAAVQLLRKNKIGVRTFIMLRPPGLSEEEGIHWTKRSLDYAFETGSECCTIIPTRAGNGAMDRLQSEGHFTPPLLSSLEEVLGYGISMGKGPVFADTWDLQLFSACSRCFEARRDRLEAMNLTQAPERPVTCIHCKANL